MLALDSLIILLVRDSSLFSDAISHFESVKLSGMFVFSQTMNPWKGYLKLFAPKIIWFLLIRNISLNIYSFGCPPSVSLLCTLPLVLIVPVCSSSVRYGGSQMARSTDLSAIVFIISRQLQLCVIESGVLLLFIVIVI